MGFYGWHNCPPAARQQIDDLVSTLTDRLAERLIGIYLHGSLAMDCFNPNHSDLDLLVITVDRLPPSLKRQIIAYLLVCSQQPQPIEISVLTQAQLRPWQYPTPFDLHYSEMWRAAYTRDLAAGQAWDETEQRDPDLAAHITIINQRGICLAGAPITAIFPAVPSVDYRASIAGDILDALDTIAADPVYAILNCCRTYAYLRDGHIFSKAEGGAWAIDVLPADLRPTVATAMAAYCADIEQQPFEPQALGAFAAHMRQVLAPILV
jgi:hypothetical protein